VEKNGKNFPKENNSKRRNPVFPACIGDRKMIAETSIPIFVLSTSSLTAAFLHYNTKYRKFIKENVANQNSNQTSWR